MRSRSILSARRPCATSSIFPAHFSPKAELITLERNYRSTQPILAAANAVIDLASERFTKNLWSDRASSDLPALVNVTDDTAQAGYVVETVLANREAGIASNRRPCCFVHPTTAPRSKSS